jgi:hypothetical protein
MQVGEDVIETVSQLMGKGITVLSSAQIDFSTSTRLENLLSANVFLSYML